MVTNRIAPELFQSVNDYKRTILWFDLRGTGVPESACDGALAAALEGFRRRFSSSELLKDEVHLTAWRQAFQAVGIAPNKFRPSVDALARRAVDRDLTLPIPLVNLGTAVSLTYLTPIGVHSLEGFEDSTIEVKRASGIESFRSMSSEDDPEHPEPDEVILSTGEQVLVRRWLWRQGRPTSIAPSSRLLQVHIDQLSCTSDAEVQRARSDFEQVLGPAASHATLSATSPEAKWQC